MAVASGGIAKKSIFEIFTGGHSVDTRGEPDSNQALSIERTQDRRRWTMENVFPILRSDCKRWFNTHELADALEHLRPAKISRKAWVQKITKHMISVEKSVTYVLEYEMRDGNKHKVHLYRLKPELWNIDNVARL